MPPSKLALAALLAACAAVACAAAPAPYTTRLVKEQWTAAPEGWVRGPRAHADAPLEAHVFVRQTNLDALEGELMAVSDPRSPRYGQHLSRDEVDRLVAPRTESVVEVLAWLQFHGVDTARDVDANGNADALRVRATVRQLEELLGCQYYLFRHAPTGALVVRADGRYSLPDEVHAHVDFVGPTIRFPASPAPMRAAPRAAGADAADNTVTPAFLRDLYSVTPYQTQTAKGVQGVASFLGQYFSQSDLQSFFRQLSPASVGQVPAVIGPNQEGQPGVEASLDIQYLMGVGANVTTQFWSTAGQQPGNPGSEPFLVWLFKVSNATSHPWVFSISYADNEYTVNKAYGARVNAEFQKAGVRGISMVVGSGDGGVGGAQPTPCTDGQFIPTFPGASPFLTTVGGTTGGSLPERAAQLSGGGFSNYWARPQYQESFVSEYLAKAQNLPPSSSWNQTGNGFPDVAAQALNYQVVVGGFLEPVDGTSCATPAFASVVSLLNDARFAAGKGPLGFLNPLFYQNPGAFNDVPTGNNPGCNGNGFTAAAGWDPVTGLGTPNFAKLRALVLSLQ